MGGGQSLQYILTIDEANKILLNDLHRLKILFNKLSSNSNTIRCTEFHYQLFEGMTRNFDRNLRSDNDLNATATRDWKYRLTRLIFQEFALEQQSPSMTYDEFLIANAFLKTAENFIKAYELMKQTMFIFNWIDVIQCDFRGLENAKQTSEKFTETPIPTEFSEEEYQVLSRYFDQNILNNRDIKKSQQVLEQLFDLRDIHFKLRNRIIESFLYGSNELGLRPKLNYQESEIIETILKGELNLKMYAMTYMQKGDKYYIIPKKFWTQWQDQANCEPLFETGSNQLKPLILDQNIVVIPQRVMIAFKKWYGCERLIQREVKSCPQYSNTPEDQLQGNDLYTKLDAVVLSLELDEIYIRFGLLEENGDKPIYLYDLYVSKFIIMVDLKEKICAKFGFKNLQDIRIWQKQDYHFTDQDLIKKLEDFPFMMDGMKFYIERKLENDIWPTDLRQMNKNQKNNSKLKTVGCMNLGNSCYLNSVIQCLANSPFFQEYFCQDIFYPPTKDYSKYHDYRKHINTFNNMGYGGNIVKAFAQLVQSLWSSQIVCINEPRKFKSVFSGYQQTLSQTTETQMNLPMSIGAISQEETGVLQLSFFLGSQSTAINVLNASIPEFHLTSIQYCHYHYQSLVQLTDQKDHQELFRDKLERTRKQSMNFEVFENTFQILNLEKPMRIQLKLDQNFKLQDLQKYLINNFPQLDILEESLEFTELSIYRFDSIFESIHDFQYKKTGITAYPENSTFYCAELLNKNGKDNIQKYYQSNWSSIQSQSKQLFLLYKEDYESKESSLLMELDTNERNENISDDVADSNQEEGMMIQQVIRTINHIDFFVQQKLQFMGQSKIDLRQPNEFIVVCMNRKIIKENLYYLKEHRVAGFGHPFIIMANSSTTGRQLYEEIWMKSRFLLNLSLMKETQDRYNLWWTNKEYDANMGQQLSPFVLKYVKNQFQGEYQLCSHCDWTLKCFGCLVMPDDENIYQSLQSKSFIAIDWNHNFLDKYVQLDNFKPVDYFGQQTPTYEPYQDVQLSECLRLFNQVEVISEDAGMHCSKCTTFTEHHIQSSLSMLPPILIIQLKRFKVLESEKRKINQNVIFPLYDLDLSQYLSLSNQDQSQNDMSTKYDLYAVVNHFGTINRGHYTSAVKNLQTNNWVSYDDSSVKDIPESKVRSQYAYILFYQRKDLISKNLRQVFPFISQYDKYNLFRGKPIKHKDPNIQGAYVWNYDPKAERPIHLKALEGQDIHARIEDLQLDEEIDDLREINKMQADALKGQSKGCQIY
ncbi:ubiquitin carboxyl-terminal hydrolase 11 [Stylonychia lemnae]|uniref:Ubiquitin carboxyl-terminal hydrolase 11 n=1 Tax=Stylonychia lemnae TaxID=5949 RepID=A0A078AFX0_STYLE|nr:ubiquitin carboxyl-terminal hydrolase 11 [Stylonychia lemnae]|eukprot:CDW80741.1 ubiquitin carboxyl-terminal hydrolase 11 [Stylonychia lemnae]